MANPSSLISVTESQVFSDNEKEKMMKLIERIMMLSSEFNIMVIGNDKELERKFIDDSYSVWKDECAPELKKIMIKIGDRWEERLKSKPQKEDKDLKRMYG